MGGITMKISINKVDRNQVMKKSQKSTEQLTDIRFAGWQWIVLSLLTGLLLSIISSVMVWQYERNFLRYKFKASTKKVAIVLQEAINDDVAVFQELEAFYGAVTEVEEVEFQSFLQSSMSQNVSLDVVGWIPYLSHPQPLTEELQGESDLLEESQQKTQRQLVAEKQESLTIKYLASKSNSELNVGLDLALDTTLSNFNQAKDTGKPVLLTYRDLSIASDNLMVEKKFNIWAISAIYKKPLNHSTVQIRRQTLKGFILGSFNLADLFEAILVKISKNQQSNELEILNTSNLVFFQPHEKQVNEQFNYSEIGEKRDDTLAVYEGKTKRWTEKFQASQELDRMKFICQNPNTCIRAVEIGDRQLYVEFIPTSAYLKAQPTSKIGLTLLLGLVSTGIVSSYIPSLLSRYRKNQQEQELLAKIQQEVMELKQQKSDLEILLETTTEHSDTIENQLQKLLAQNADAYEELQEANVELRQINSEIMLIGKMSNLLQVCFTEEEAYATIAEFMRRLFPDRSGGIYRICDSKNIVESMVQWGDNASAEMVFNPHDCWALRSGRSHLFDNEHSSLPCKHYHGLSPEQSLCIPLMAQGETFGLLHLNSQTSENKLSEGQQKLALTVAKHTGLALANLKLRETLRIQSIRDPLTGLYNRRYLEEYLEQETQRSKRSEKPFAVVMIDVDHFKKFNDTFGHEAGDMVLQELGKFLQENVRNGDIACRYGGEELTLILPEASLHDSEIIAEKIRQGVKKLNIHSRRQYINGITISVGVAVFPEDGLTGQQLVDAADRALYRAKKEGRDRVAIASRPTNIPPLLKALS